MTDDTKEEIKAILKDAAVQFKCGVEDLEWRIDPQGAIHVRVKE